jgi:hypothetical protein
MDTTRQAASLQVPRWLFSETVVIRLHAASAYDGRMFSAWIDGVDCSGKVLVIKGWDKFEDYTGDVNLSPDHHTLKLISMMAT